MSKQKLQRGATFFFTSLADAAKMMAELATPFSFQVMVNKSKPKDTCEGEKMADEVRDLIEILEEHNPVDMAKYINYVSAPQAGAIATFSGTTRDTFEGKTVLELQYEAYVPMAVRCIKSACQSARSSWNLMSIAVAHRLGPVPVGETSVFIAVSSVHRDDALDACKFLIDEIKASVPIWKKEVYTNGEVWKENKEFLERKSELEKGGRDEYRCCGRQLESKPNGHGCCGAKVKIDDGCNGGRREAE